MTFQNKLSIITNSEYYPIPQSWPCDGTFVPAVIIPMTHWEAPSKQILHVFISFQCIFVQNPSAFSLAEIVFQIAQSSQHMSHQNIRCFHVIYHFEEPIANGTVKFPFPLFIVVQYSGTQPLNFVC